MFYDFAIIIELVTLKMLMQPDQLHLLHILSKSEKL